MPSPRDRGACLPRLSPHRTTTHEPRMALEFTPIRMREPNQDSPGIYWPRGLSWGGPASGIGCSASWERFLEKGCTEQGLSVLDDKSTIPAGLLRSPGAPVLGGAFHFHTETPCWRLPGRPTPPRWVPRPTDGLQQCDGQRAPPCRSGPTAHAQKAVRARCPLHSKRGDEHGRMCE